MRNLAELQLHERDRTAIARAADLLRSRIAVHQIILFGSKARGDDQRESDIDLLAVTAESPRDDLKSELRQRLTELEGEYDFNLSISPLYVSRDDWEGPWLAMPLRQNILREGAVV